MYYTGWSDGCTPSYYIILALIPMGEMKQGNKDHNVVGKKRFVAGYIRTSTDLQDVGKQRDTIRNYAKKEGLKVSRFFEAEISSSRSMDARNLKSLNDRDKGIMPFNAFQDQGNEPLSTLLSATSNSTVLNFKLTDIIEAGVYNKKDQKPKVKRVETVSTVHIAQEPLKEWEGEEEMKTLSAYQWKEGDVVLVDKNFNTLTDPRDEKVVAKFGKNSDSRRLFAVNEVCVQAIGAGDMIVTFFAEDPTVYGYEQVSVWEGKFRNNAKITKSTRGWTTTIRFGQPKIVGEDGKDFKYRYPRTIQHDIQKRPNLPPPPYDNPEKREEVQLWTYSYTLEEKVKTLDADTFFTLNLNKDNYWSSEYVKYKEYHNEEIPLVYSLPHVLVWYLDWDQDKEEYTLFASGDSSVSEPRYNGIRYYKSKTASDLISKAKTLKADKWWNKDEGKAYIVVLGWGDERVLIIGWRLGRRW